MIYLTLPDKISIFFSKTIGKAGVIAFGSTLLLFLPFTAFTDLSSINFLFNETATTSGTVDGWFHTNSTVNDQYVMGYTYNFILDGLPYSGESYSHLISYDEGDPVTIEYVVNNPVISRINNMNSSAMPLWVLAIVGIFPLIGLIIFLIGIKVTRKTISAISNGEITKGEMIDSSPTNTTINNQRLYALTYKYNTDRGEFENITKTIYPYKFSNQEDLIYSNFHPEKSVLIRTLPDKIASKLDILR